LSDSNQLKNVAESLYPNSDVAYDSTYIIAKKRFTSCRYKISYSTSIQEKFMDRTCLVNTTVFLNFIRCKKNGVNAKRKYILISHEGTQVPNQKIKKNPKRRSKRKAEEILAQVTANPDSF
jgi:peptidyl-prolyl cis-trans isomerase D